MALFFVVDLHLILQTVVVVVVIMYRVPEQKKQDNDWKMVVEPQSNTPQ